jgi:hypothetical protein
VCVGSCGCLGCLVIFQLFQMTVCGFRPDAKNFVFCFGVFLCFFCFCFCLFVVC